MSYLDQQFNLQNAIASLPKEVGQAIGELDITSEIWEICKIFGLLISETGNVCEETAKVIAGETRPENFVENIHSKLTDDNKNRANEIAGEINNKILIPIKDAYTKVSMKNVPNYTQSTSQISNETTTPATDYPLPATNSSPVSHTDRDFLMYEIENPTPAGVSTVPYNQTRQDFSKQNLSGQAAPSTGGGQAPVNLPTEAPKEIPIIRTMPRDMAQTTENKQQVTYNQPNRGKFGQGTPPTIRQNRPNQLSTETQNPKPEIRNNNENVKNEIIPKTTNYSLPRAVEQSSLRGTATTNSSPSFIPSQPGMVGGTLRGNSQQITRQTFEGQKFGGQANPSTQQVSTPPTPKPQQPIPQAPHQNFVPQSLSGQVRQDFIPSNKISNENLNEQPIPQTPISKPQIPNEPEKEIAPTTNYQQPTANSPKTTNYSIPTTDSPNDIMKDKLSNTVSMPSEKKRYVVDPYREPLE